MKEYQISIIDHISLIREKNNITTIENMADLYKKMQENLYESCVIPKEFINNDWYDINNFIKIVKNA